MRQRTSKLCLLPTFFAMPAGLATTDVCAQDSREKTLEEIVVTGSRIARRDYLSVSPITTIDRAEIDASGTTEIINLLNDLPQADPNVGGGTADPPDGSSNINLRALGGFRQLLLLNGRRYPNSGVAGVADLNALPPVLIERVEVITGGASAVYGSDAVAGVVNFILRNDFDGFELSAQYDVTERGDGDTYNIDIAYGTPFSAGRGNIALFGNYYKRSIVYESERSFSRTQLTSNDDTGEVVPDGSFFSPSGAINGLVGVDFYTFDGDGIPRLWVEPDDRFDTASLTALLAPMERFSANALGHFDFNDKLRALFEVNLALSTPEQVREDVFFGFVDVNTDRPDISPELRTLLASDYDPDGDGIASIGLLRQFTAEQGQAIRKNEREFYRGMIGIEGELGGGWTWSADYSYAKTDLDARVVNDVSVSRIMQGLLVDPVSAECFDPSGGCVPVNPFGAGVMTQAAADFIALDNSNLREDLTEQIVNATFAGPIFEAWAGDIDVAVGVEYREDKINNLPGENMLTGDSVFLGSRAATSGVISVKEAFAEARIPLLADARWAEYLGLEIGGRWSDYKVQEDDIWTWKFGAEWAIAGGLRLRAMRQRAIRAPNAFELFSASEDLGNFFALGPFFDQCSASRDPAGNGLTDLCIAQGIPASEIGTFEASFFPTAITFSSNPSAEAEESDTLTVGIVWQPEYIDGLSISVDYFDIEIDNAVTIIGPNDATNLCFLTRDVNDQFCSTLTRGPSGNFATAKVTFVNAALIRTDGFDIAIKYGWAADSLALSEGGANFGLSLVATHYLEAGTQGSLLAPFFGCAGKFGALCNNFGFLGALPEWRTNTRLTYQSGPLMATMRWQWIDGMVNSEDEFRMLQNRPPPVLAVPELSAASYFDLTLQYDFNESLNLRFGVVNMFDKDPPFMGGAAESANTDPRTYDTLGRRYFSRLTKSW